jgi:hypothetical protein
MIALCLALLTVSWMSACIGCNHEEDKNLPHDSSLNNKPVSPTSGGGGKGVQPPPP